MTLCIAISSPKWQCVSGSSSCSVFLFIFSFVVVISFVFCRLIASCLVIRALFVFASALITLIWIPAVLGLIQRSLLPRGVRG